MATDEDVIADIEKTTLNVENIPDIPAYNLKYGTINEISMMLCAKGALKNWKDVADGLGFENCEISGHFDNFLGCDPAKNMLNEWIFRRGGTVRKLVEVFNSLELYACLDELFADKGYQSACKYFQSGKHLKLDGDSDDASSGTSSISDEQNSDAIKPVQKLVSDAIKPVQILVSDAIKPLTPSQHKDKQDNEAKQMQHEKLVTPEKKTVPKSPGSESVITYKSWPDNKPTQYNRCDSEPQGKVTSRKPFFKRSISVDSGKKKQKEGKDKQKKKFRFLKKLRPQRSESQLSDVLQVEGHYHEDKQTEPTNLFPLQEAEIPTSVDRSISSGSEESLPLQPSSPNSLGYESGSECEENQSKKIYIVCNPDEPDNFKKAYQLYAKFCEKGYECIMFATNFDEVLEIGQYRYQMEQVNAADYLFLCVSKELKRIFEESSKIFNGYIDDNCKSLRHVSDFIMSHLSRQCRNTNGKFMSILLAEDSHDHIPCFMGSYLSYKWPEQEARMENTIHRRTELAKFPVSNTRVLASQKVFGVNIDCIAKVKLM